MNTQTPQEPAFDAAALAEKSGGSAEAASKNALLEWTAPSHHDHERTHRWYVVAGSVSAFIAVVALFTGAWSVSIVTVVVAMLYVLSRGDSTPRRRIQIEKDGFTFEEQFIPWSDCIDFWLIKTPVFTELHIARKKGSPKHVIIQTGDIDPLQLRVTVSQFLPLRPDQREHLLDAFIRICKL